MYKIMTSLPYFPHWVCASFLHMCDGVLMLAGLTEIGLVEGLLLSLSVLHITFFLSIMNQLHSNKFY